ncbi:hypothetical protein [Flavobacterium sp.]|jgi:hypothetical protein|uniref:hypothetical protein n=1 Tax=Flavobacterium sp. TaxID=239 RepID=UPI0022C35BB6|nr:hypothetical protein [Flavobacterium sp.]MCZ8169689.1 hypothetical protein [Flavobacterium sp.]MCZ8297987.1 hypothetical protein [Flavobacterium sp.]
MKILIYILSFIILTACNKDDNNENQQDQLPPITTLGANTAGCRINGKILIPKNGSQAIGGSPIYGLNKTQGNNFWPDKNDYWQLEIANKRDPNSAGIVLWIKNMQTGNGDYVIGQSNGELYVDGPNNNQIIASIKENGVYKTYWSGTNAGIIKISRSDLFVGTSIFSGTFNAVLYNKDNPSETINITDGRFDINGITLNQ